MGAVSNALASLPVGRPLSDDPRRDTHGLQSNCQTLLAIGNRKSPVGYMLASVTFAGGQPTSPPTSTTALRRMLSNADEAACPDACFRPVGLAVDGTRGRVFMSSDATGDIWILAPADVTTGTPTIGSGDDDDDDDAAAAASGSAGARAFGDGGVGRSGLTLLACLLAAIAAGTV